MDHSEGEYQADHDPPAPEDKAPSSLSFAPTKERYLFMCSECGVPKLMPALPINQPGQTFYCAVCLEPQFFLRIEASLNEFSKLTRFVIIS